MDITIRCLDLLAASGKMNGLLIHVESKVFELNARVDRLSLPNISILMEDRNDRTMLGVNDSTSHHDFQIGDLMILDALNVDGSVSRQDDMDIVSSDTTIRTTVDESPNFSASMLANIVNRGLSRRIGYNMMDIGLE